MCDSQQPKPHQASSRVLKNGASSRDPALHGVWKCSHIAEYAVLFNTLLNSRMKRSLWI
jgi:hypothetical protein